MNRVLITGANRGIGLALARLLTERGDEVIGTCRRPADELEVTGARVIENVDVSEPKGVERLAQELGDEPLDWLINNAGILDRDSLDEPNDESMLRQFEVNALGPLRVTRALRKNLSEGSRVGIVTSRMGSVGDNTSGGYYGYRASKAAVNMVGKSLARDLHGQGIAVALIHPGMVATEMTGGQGIPPEKAARGIIQRMDALSLDSSGSFWHAEGYELPW